MCTMTVVPLPGGRVRVAFNRDEQRSRPPARPPRRWRVGGRRAVFPVDPQSGGTWLAVNDAGLLLALLNVNPHNPATRPRAAGRSRGQVIPALLGCDSPAAAVGTVEEVIEYAEFAPFRLVLVGSGVAADVRWDGLRTMVVTRLVGGGPLLYTSSGLGDHLVEDIRRELFEDAFAGPADDWAAAQDRYHRCPLPGREHLGVNMARADARTVSYAAVVLGPDGAEFTYRADAPGSAGEPVTLALPFTAAGVG
ncbi:MAG: NRDE family protein [Gemmataceae bacterium]|nr:NRDE family protein [Gemmataceae bacterium]